MPLNMFLFAEMLCKNISQHTFCKKPRCSSSCHEQWVILITFKQPVSVFFTIGVRQHVNNCKNPRQNVVCHSIENNDYGYSGYKNPSHNNVTHPRTTPIYWAATALACVFLTLYTSCLTKICQDAGTVDSHTKGTELCTETIVHLYRN